MPRVYQELAGEKGSHPYEAVNANHIYFQSIRPTNTTNKLYSNKGTLYFNTFPINGSCVVSTMPYLNGVSLTDINEGFETLIDESDALNSLLANTNEELTKMGLTTDTRIIVNVEAKNEYIFLNSDIKVQDNQYLNFITPIVCASGFSLRVEGSFSEIPSAIDDSPVLLQDASFTNTFDIDSKDNDLSGWAVNDLISIRDLNEAKRYDAVIQSITEYETGKYTITTNAIIQEDFVVGDVVRRYKQSKLSQALAQGECRIYLSDITAIATGDFIVVKSKYKAGDFQSYSYTHRETGKYLSYSNNDYKYQVCKVVQKATSSGYVIVDIPMANDYTIDETYILVLNQKQNVGIDNLRVVSLQQGTQPRPNNHLVYINRCVDTIVRNITFTDMDKNITISKQHPYVDNIVQVRSSYGVNVENVNITRWNKEDSASGASYGLTCYYSTNCLFTKIRASSLRHPLLLQGCNYCKFTSFILDNTLVSGCDLHGLNEKFNDFNDFTISCSRDQNSLDITNTTTGNSTIALIRLGNSFHPTGASYNTFRNFNLLNSLPRGDIKEVYGISIVPISSYNHFENIRMYNIDIGISGYDHDNYPLGDTQQMISTNNSFHNIFMDGNVRNIELKGTRNSSNDYVYEGIDTTDPFVSAVNIVDGNTILTIGNATNLIGYDYIDYYENRFLLFQGVANPSIAQVSQHTRVGTSILFTITGLFTTYPAINEKIIIVKDLATSISPIRDWSFIGCKFMNNKNIKCCEHRWSSNIRYLDCYFYNNNSLNSTSTTNYICDVDTVGGFVFANCFVDNCKRGFGLSNSADVIIVDNRALKLNTTGLGTGSNWIHDYGYNQNMIITNNILYGNTENDTGNYSGLSYKLTTTSTYKTQPLYIGTQGTTGSASNYCLETDKGSYAVSVNGKFRASKVIEYNDAMGSFGVSVNGFNPLDTLTIAYDDFTNITNVITQDIIPI
jgi:hypothetical protein